MSLLTTLMGPITGLLTEVVVDKDLRYTLAHKLATMAEKHSQALLEGQLEINKVEAAHKSLFVAGWRPAIGWTCGIALLYSTILSPILDIWFVIPKVDTSLLQTVLMGMLGLGAMRSYEKTKGVQRER